jgi:hypothetical protein
VNGTPTTLDGRRVTAALDRLPGQILDNTPGASD